MKKINIFIFVLTILLTGFVFKPTNVKADTYSNEDNRKSLSVDKKLRSIHSNEYVDNIASSIRVFHQGNIVEFKIKITNTGTTNMRNIKITDNLPPFLKLIFFPGTYNGTDNKVEWTIDELNAGHSQDFLIRAKIDQAENVTYLTKETNVTKACVDEICEKDDASYFIGGSISTTKGDVIIPDTGFSGLIFQTGLAITVGLSGLALRKKARGY